MRYNRLGSSDIEVSEVCLGTMTWGEQNTEAEAHQQLNYADERGVNFLDAAELYPVPPKAETQGLTEAYIGTWLKSQPRDKWVVATKVIGASTGLKWIRNGGGLDETNIRKALEDSLKRLGTDYVDLYQIHWPDRYVPMFGETQFDKRSYKTGTPILETMKVMDALIREGKIRTYGLSNETAYGIDQFMHLADIHALAKPVSIQNAYSLLNRAFDAPHAESCFHSGIGLLAYSPLAFGLLTGKYLNGAQPPKARLTVFPQWAKRYNQHPNIQAAVADYCQLAQDHDWSSTAMALAFIASRFFTTSTIIGATNLDQLRENIDAFQRQLPDSMLEAIDQIHQRYPNPCP